MRVSSLISVIVLLTLVSGYNIFQTIIGDEFYNLFDWQAIEDPTHGRVQYVDEGTSRQLNLTYAFGDTFILRGDYKETLQPSGPGRKSVRIKSKQKFTEHVAVFDVRHMPQGCGTWPAIWEVTGANWPEGGEIDILEGANDQGPNAVTLHTSADCKMPHLRIHKGTSVNLDCTSSAQNNEGCGVKLDSPNSFGPQFNNIGGGWYAVQRTSNDISVWFWSRIDPNVPDSVRIGANYAEPVNWGKPSAYFPNTNCNIQSHFEEHNIIINLTFCGDLGSATYNNYGCPSTCIDQVNNNPQSFEGAYFDIASIRIYQ